MDGLADAAKDSELVLAIPADPELIGVARLFAAAVCRHVGIHEDRIDDVKVAVSEAVTNAIQTHLAAGIPDSVSVRVRPDDGGATISVVDLGSHTVAADPIAVEDNSSTPPSGLYEGSLGLSLIRSLFPDVVFGVDDALGTIVRFHAARNEQA